MRDFIAAVEAAGQLHRVTGETDWRHAIGEQTRREQHGGRRRAMLFDNVKGYPGFSVLTNGLGTVRRIALALAMDPDIGRAGLLHALRQRCARPVPPVMSAAEDDECAFFDGDTVDLESLPVPWWHPLDAGRYLGTWHLNISKDPRTGARNAGVYRMMIIDKRTATVSVSPASHLTAHIRQAEEMGRPLEMAVAIGVPEPLVMAAAAAFPAGSDELAFAGGMIGAPVELAPCRTVRCEAPADSQIVIEGTISPGNRVADGPFFDYAGVPSVNPRAYRFDVTGMTVRRNAVFRGAAIGLPGAEDHVLYSLLAGLDLADFHGRRVKQKVQSFLFRMRWYRLLQWSGRAGAIAGARGGRP